MSVSGTLELISTLISRPHTSSSYNFTLFDTAHPTTAVMSANSTSLEASASLFAKAKALTRTLFRGDSLPEFLQPYLPTFWQLLHGMTPVAAGAGLYYLFQRHRRDEAKIQLAIFHVLRVVEARPDFDDFADKPQQLISEMQVQVLDLVEHHLTLREGNTIFRELKRKVWLRELARAEVQRDTVPISEESSEDEHSKHPEPSTQRRRISERSGHTQQVLRNQNSRPLRQGQVIGAWPLEEDVSQEEVTDEEQDLAPKLPSGHFQDPITISDIESDIELIDVPRTPLQTHSVQQLSPPDLGPQTTLDTPPQTSSPGRSYGFTYSSDSKESERELERSPTIRGGYGFTYSPPFGEESPQASPNVTTPTPQTRPSFIQRATQATVDVNPLKLRNIPRSTLEEARAIVAGKRAVRPQNPFPRTPPNQLGMIKGDNTVGTNLSPIAEGDSAPNSAEGGTRYRVNERRTFFNRLEAERQKSQKARRPFQASVQDERDEYLMSGALLAEEPSEIEQLSVSDVSDWRNQADAEVAKRQFVTADEILAEMDANQQRFGPEIAKLVGSQTPLSSARSDKSSKKSSLSGLQRSASAASLDFSSPSCPHRKQNRKPVTPKESRVQELQTPRRSGRPNKFKGHFTK